MLARAVDGRGVPCSGGVTDWSSVRARHVNEWTARLRTPFTSSQARPTTAFPVERCDTTHSPAADPEVSAISVPSVSGVVVARAVGLLAV
jgi:hypothetical protein